MKNSALILASFVADSLALGPHWIYDTTKIDQEFGRIEGPEKPLADSYHKDKNLGEFTHYGDQTLLLMQSIAGNNGFNLRNFAAEWQKYMANYSGYRDKATAQTLENLNSTMDFDRCGSTSSDLGGAARIAPLVYRYQNDRDTLLDSVRKQTMLTHNNKTVLAGAEALARICWEVMHGTRPAEALGNVVEGGIDDMDLDMRLGNSLDSANLSSREAIASFGQACGIEAGLPGVFYLVLKYQDDLETALIENVMAGGDSAARGLCLGMILGAYGGLDAIPGNWLDSMVQYGRICELIKKIDTGI